jgi:DNA replication and repair protein RecF
VPIHEFAAENFRCLERAELRVEPGYNLIYGANASGKTSILEAMAYLGRGRSFRGAATADLVRHGSQAFVLFGRVSDGGRQARVGVRNGRDGLEVRIDGEAGGGAAALAAALPLQVIDPEVHGLVGGAPDGRRRYLDWIAFHVEHDYLETWRRFRRALRQRNAALRDGASRAVVDGWTAEFVELAIRIDAGRRTAVARVSGALEATGAELLGSGVEIRYHPGWNEDRPLAELLEAALDRERQQGSTLSGPHRADLGLRYDEHRARKRVSRGQQKLLACAMILAATETAQAALGRPLLLLMDDPAAELDAPSLSRLMGRVAGLGSQVVATSLVPDARLFGGEAAVFHVEHGRLDRVG